MRHADFDTIVIGSGLGGLTAATSLAGAGQDVLLLEQHYNPGGWSQQIPVAGHRFCGGIHYTGELGAGQRMRKIFEDVGIANEMTFMEMNRNGYDHGVCPEDRFDFCVGREALAAKLKDRFPREKKGIDAYLKTCEIINSQWEDCTYLYRAWRELPTLPFRAPVLTRFGFSSWQKIISHFVKDPRLQWVLATQVLDSGLPPDRLSGALGSIVTAHFMEGAYYPSEGGHGFVRAFIRTFRKYGGTLKVRAPVAEILIEGRGSRRQAVGVRLQDGSTLTARNIISSADLSVTYGKLVKEEYLSRTLRWRLKRVRWSSSCALLFIVLKTDPRELGLDSGNIHFSEVPDWNRAYSDALDPNILSKRDDFPLLFLTPESLKDPVRPREGEGYMVSTILPLDYDTFRKFQETQHGSRPVQYEDLKRRVVDMTLDTIEKFIPNFREHILTLEASTPLTNTHYIPAAGGSMYGTENSVFQSGPFSFPMETGIKNLTICGHSTVAHGVLGGGLSGRIAASLALGCAYKELPRAAGQQLKVVQSETARKGAAAGR